MIESAIATAPNAGSVSSPENGGATAAPTASAITSSPRSRSIHPCSNSRAPRGRENRSTRRIHRPMSGMALSVVVGPSSRCCQRSGSQIVRRPSTI